MDFHIGGMVELLLSQKLHTGGQQKAANLMPQLSATDAGNRAPTS